MALVHGWPSRMRCALATAGCAAGWPASGRDRPRRCAASSRPQAWWLLPDPGSAVLAPTARCRAARRPTARGRCSSPPARSGLALIARCRASRSDCRAGRWRGSPRCSARPGRARPAWASARRSRCRRSCSSSATGSPRAAGAAATPSWSASIGIVIALIVRLRLLPGLHDPVERGQDNAGALRAGRVPRQVRRPLDLGPRLPHGGRCAAASPGTRCSSRVLVGVGTTALGLAFALIATRTGFRAKGALRVLTVLPIITPPFVIGLALILLFGRSGAVTALLVDWFGIPRSRWIYGLPGVLIAQLLAFTPIAFLVLIGVVQGISPSLEEASQTLRAKRWTTFRTVTLPLIRPGPRQRLPARLRREPGGLRQSAGARRQFRGAVDQDLLRRRRRGARPGARRRAVASCCSPSRSARSGCSTRWLGQEGLHDRHRQGRCRPAAAAAAARALARATPPRCPGRCSPS